MIYCCTCRHRAVVVTVLTDGGPYVSADDSPDQVEIHPSGSSGGTKLCDRDVQLSLDLRKRYLKWIFPPVSIAHRHHRLRRRRRVCGSSGLSIGCSDFHGIPAKSRAPTEQLQQHTLTPLATFHGKKTPHAKEPGRWMVFPVTPRLWNGFIRAGDGPSWRQSASRSGTAVALDVAATRNVHNAQPSDDYTAHAHWAPLAPQKENIWRLSVWWSPFKTQRQSELNADIKLQDQSKTIEKQYKMNLTAVKEFDKVGFLLKIFS